MRLKSKGIPCPTVVTILYVLQPFLAHPSADSGVRHLSKFQNDEVMQARGLRVDVDIQDILSSA